MQNTNLAGVTDWIKAGFEKFKEAIGINQPKPVVEGTALVEAQKLLTYCNVRPIKMGDKGDIVVTLQFLLDVLGYKTYTGEVPDGIFGPMTYRAVIEYQKSRGLKPDGVVGRLTAFKIYQEIAERTRVARILPTAANRWINRAIFEKIEKIQRQRPEFVVVEEEGGEKKAMVVPKETKQIFFSTPEAKKYMVAIGIILAAYLLSEKGGKY